MPDNPEYGERTEPATPRKREEARKKGQVAKSTEVNYALVLLASVLGLYFMSGMIIDGISRLMHHYFADLQAFELDRAGAFSFLARASWETIKTFLPFSILIAFVGLMANVLQIGFLLTAEPLTPKWDRLNPFSGLSRMFSWRGFGELVKSFAKVVAVGLVCYLTIRSEIVRFFTVSHSSTSVILLSFGQVLFLLAIRCVLVMLLIAALDFAFQRWQYEKNLRMSVQEVREEMKELYGDPNIKARVRQIQRQMARQRMIAKVPEAEVVVTNPTHYAVALDYDSEMAAPVVIAKGRGSIAQRIRQVAEEHNVPIVEDPELARALYHSVDLDVQVPEVLYQAVAKVLAYVYGLKRNAPTKAPTQGSPLTQRVSTSFAQ